MSESEQILGDARVARDRGRISQALDLFAQAAALRTTTHGAHYEAGTFVLDVNRNLEGLDALYARQRESFGLSAEEFPVLVPGAKLGPEGWEFGIGCLMQASAFPGAPIEWQERLAEELASRGRLRQALLWRQRVNQSDFMRPGNRLAIARLSEELDAFDEAARQYEDLLDTWPDNPGAILGLTWIQERQGHAVETQRLACFFPAESRESPEVVIGRALRILWAACQRGSAHLSLDVRQKLRELVQAVSAQYAEHPECALAGGFGALLDGDMEVARHKFLRTSLAMARGQTLGTGTPIYDDTLHDAMRWASAFLVDPVLVGGKPGSPRSADTEGLERAQAHEMWVGRDFVASMNAYTAALRRHHVARVPLQYEICGEYKVLLHGDLFYAVPRRVEQFTIIDGRVYQLRGRARHLQQRVPPWLINLVYWITERLGMTGSTARLKTLGGRIVERGRFSNRRWLRRVAGWLVRLSWALHGVRNISVATTRAELMALIDSKSRNQ